MAGYWTRLQFPLKVLIELDSVSVHKKGKKNKRKKNLADVQLSVTSPPWSITHIYISCFRALLAVKTLYARSTKPS